MTVKARDIINALLVEEGRFIGSSLAASNRADLTDIDDDDLSVNGYAVSETEAQKDTIRPLSRLFDFDVIERDGTFAAVRRGHEPVVEIREGAPNGFVRMRDGETHEEERTQEAEIPTEISVEYLNPDNDYQTATASAKRIVSPVPTTYNRRKEVIRLPLAVLPDQATAAAEVALYEADTQRTRFRIRLPRDYMYLVESDVILLILKDGYSFRARIMRMDIGKDYSVLLDVVQEAAGEYRKTEVRNDGVIVPVRPGSGGSPKVSLAPREVGGDVVLFLLDTPLLRDADAAVVTVPPRAIGYWAAARERASNWRGGSLIRRDPATDARRSPA